MIRVCACATCKHYDRQHLQQHGEARCVAFPKGIPMEILVGRNKHTTRHPEQVGDHLFTPQDIKNNH